MDMLTIGQKSLLVVPFPENAWANHVFIKETPKEPSGHVNKMVPNVPKYAPMDIVLRFLSLIIYDS